MSRQEKTSDQLSIPGGLSSMDYHPQISTPGFRSTNLRTLNAKELQSLPVISTEDGHVPNVRPIQPPWNGVFERLKLHDVDFVPTTGGSSAHALIERTTPHLQRKTYATATTKRGAVIRLKNWRC